MNQWALLKELQFEDRTVRLLKSNVALRVWKGETIYKTGEIDSRELEDESMAWSCFCGECIKGIYDMEDRHCTPINNHTQEITG